MLEKLTQSVEIIQALGDSPNIDDGLSSEELKMKFDEAARIIKSYLNGIMVPYINDLSEAVSKQLDPTLTRPDLAAQAQAVGLALKKVLPLNGSTAMTGNLPMGGNKVTGLAAPTENADAVNKEYADNMLKEKAPAGYGWGETAALNAPYGDPDNIDRTCTFVASQGNIPASGIWFGQYIASYPDGDMTVRAKTGPVGCVCKRHKFDGVWQPWEWENPPMESSVEYRTTERWKGKPVYTQLVSFGALPSNDKKTVFFNVSGSVDDIVDLDLEVYYENKFYTAGIEEIKQYYATSDRRIVIVTNTDASSFTAVAKVKYTKT